MEGFGPTDGDELWEGIQRQTQALGVRLLPLIRSGTYSVPHEFDNGCTRGINANALMLRAIHDHPVECASLLSAIMSLVLLHHGAGVEVAHGGADMMVGDELQRQAAERSKVEEN